MKQVYVFRCSEKDLPGQMKMDASDGEIAWLMKPIKALSSGHLQACACTKQGEQERGKLVAGKKCLEQYFAEQ